MKLCMDLHTHTISSGHAYSTLHENIAAAKAEGLSILGMSDHGPGMPGGPDAIYFRNFKCIPRRYGELRLVCGAEANIMDYEGRLDLEDSVLEKLDYVIASMHILCVAPGTMAENTAASVRAMRNPFVRILGHPDDSRYPLNREEIVLAAKEEGVAIEINNASLHPKSARKGGRENILELLALCAKHRTPVLLGTDSHICDTIGHFEETLKLLSETDFPEELVLNTRPENLERILERKGF